MLFHLAIVAGIVPVADQIRVLVVAIVVVAAAAVVVVVAVAVAAAVVVQGGGVVGGGVLCCGGCCCDLTRNFIFEQSQKEQLGHVADSW